MTKDNEASGSVRIAVVVGNPKRLSRTFQVASAAACALAAALQRPADITEVDLADYARQVFDQDNPAMVRLAAEVPGHDVIIAASPTYKATYTGLLKAFFDRFPANGLAGIAAVPVMVGAARLHALAPEVHLRPLLVELGAVVPSRGLFVTEGDLDRLECIAATWAETAGPLVARVLRSAV